MDTVKNMDKVPDIYNLVMSSLDEVLVGQKEAKKVIASSMLCDTNSRILLVGNTGAGKTILTKSLSRGFNTHKIHITSDTLSSDIQNQLKNQTIDKNNMRFLHLDEFNRASGKVQSAFIELFEENQMNIDGKQYNFNDYYVFATQNNSDISGTFNVPQAIYDRFDVSVYFSTLTDSEKRKLLFEGFKPAAKSHLNMEDITITKAVIDDLKPNKNDIDLLMQIFDIIDSMKIDDKNLFAGSNIRAHSFAIKLAKLSMLCYRRDYILPADIIDFIKYLYMHRIDQNVATIGEERVINSFDDVQKKVISLKRNRDR